MSRKDNKEKIFNVKRAIRISESKDKYWRKRRDFVLNKYMSAIANFSILKKLRQDGKSNDKFEEMLSNISLEELIAAKLEATSKHTGGILFTLPLNRALPNIVRHALVYYVMSMARTKYDAAYMLSVSYFKFTEYLVHWGLWDEFNEFFDKKREKAKETGELS